MHGYETLVRVRAEFDPDCLPCHTVGFGQRGGFRSAARTPDLKGVQCESCHGPAEDHARAMKSGASWKNAFRPVTPGTCIRCHDEENSENFVYESYWPKIRH
jgi:nitrate/TMAO reductase-like tetraheme cytochrome c subunit